MSIATRFKAQKSFMNTIPISASSTQLGWREWLEVHGPKLLLFARQQSRSEQDAEDIFQEALVKLSKKTSSGEFTGGQDAWLPYLYTQIRREAIDLGRKTDRRRRREQIVVEDKVNLEATRKDPWFDSGGALAERAETLQDALQELPEKFAEVVIMKVWGERTFAEIGEALDISLNTAASRYRYGLEALRKKLAPQKDTGEL